MALRSFNSGGEQALSSTIRNWMHKCHGLYTYGIRKWTSSSRETDRAVRAASKYGRYVLEALREVSLCSSLLYLLYVTVL